MAIQPSNPFLLVGYHSPDFFCDREEETRKILEGIRNQRNMTLYSIRRMGKTALIKHVFYHLRQNREAVPLYIDLMPTDNFDDFTGKLAEAIIYQYGSLQKGLSGKLQKLISAIGASLSFDPMTGMPVVSVQLREPRQINQPLRTLLAFLAEEKHQIVLAFDEFQQLAHYPESGPEALLRSMAQEFNNIRFLFSGSHQGIMTAMFTHQGRPFYRSTQVLPLEAIDRETYQNFILAHFEKAGKAIPEAVIGEILTWCKLQTYYVQLVCNRLFARTDQVKEEDLQTVWQEIMEEEQAIFQNYKNLLTSKQWGVLEAIAREEPVKHTNATDFLQKYRLGAASSVNSAIQALWDKQLIMHGENGYVVQDALLARWLQQY